ncbi:MAG: IS66 family transposase [Acidobacteriota bacterium]|nr:IS66 family transposase [Acidobacteriota bacterium]
MPIDRKQLPDSADVLQQMVLDLIAQLDASEARRMKTENLLRQLLAARSGRRSEQITEEQLALFEAELKAQGVNVEDLSKGNAAAGGSDDKHPPASPGNTEANPRGRRMLPAHLKRERIVHDLDEAEKHCSVCAQDLREFGEETSERYEYIPAQLIVIEDVCKKYSCACTVKTAGKPSQPIEKSTAGASLLTQVIVSKFADHLPLHRQAKIFSRFGVDLSDRTMCGWMRQSADLLDPLYKTLKAFVLSSKVVGTDDTPVKVLDRNLPQTRKGRIWPYVGDRDHPAIVYDYTPTRERAGPEEFLKGFRGHLQADAYVVYDSFFTDPARGMVEVGCWAHARRHFHDALEKDRARMGGVLAMIAHLYGVEKVSRRNGLRGEALRVAREQNARPMLDKLHEYLLTIREQVLPKSDAGQAVAYTLKNWAALTRYCSDGDLSIDNNATERSLRSFAVGRNDWTFFGSDNGGKTAAVLRSFVSSCELVRIDPFAWFCDVLSRIAEHPIKRLEELLPHRWAQASW